MKLCKSTTNKHSSSKPDYFASPQTCSQKENSKRLNSNFFRRPEPQMDKTKLILQSGNLSPTNPADLAERLNLRSTFKEKFKSVTPKTKPLALMYLGDPQLSPTNFLVRASEQRSGQKPTSKNDPLSKPGSKNPINLIKNPRVNSAKNATSGKNRIVFPNQGPENRFTSKAKGNSLPKSKELFVSDKFMYLDKKLSRQIKLRFPSKHDSRGSPARTEMDEPSTYQKVLKEVEKTEPSHALSSDEQLALTASSLINVEFLSEVNIDLFLTLFAKLLTLYCFIEQGTDTYLVIREYTEIIQCPAFVVLDQLISRNTETGQDLFLSFKLEILSVLTIFYYNVENPGQEQQNLLKIVEKISFNFFCFLNILKKSCEKNHHHDQCSAITSFLETSNAEKAFKKDIDYSKTFKRNNGAILTIILSLAKDRASPIYNERLKMLIISVKSYSLMKSCEKLFEFFAQVLKNKGVLMVSEIENTQRRPSVAKKTEIEPNFILQPFNFVSLLPQKAKDNPYTLVLDLDETLVHYEETESGRGQFFLRPYSQQFIADLDPYYEIVIFTAAMKNYADWIIDRLDSQKLISHRLYRCSTKNHNGVFIKDLSKIGRELSKTIIVDNNADNFQYQPENGIFIKSWYNDPEDNALQELAQVLIYLSKKNYPDIRVGLKEMREKMAKQPQKK